MLPRFGDLAMQKNSLSHVQLHWQTTGKTYINVPSLINSYLSTVRTNAILGTCVFKLVFLKVNTFDMFVQLGKILKNKNIFLKYVLKIHDHELLFWIPKSVVTLFKFLFLTFHRLFCRWCTLKSEFSEKNK